MSFKSFKYRWWQKFIHKHNYHHMELAFPENDTIAWCHWCGLRDKVYTPKSINPHFDPETDKAYSDQPKGKDSNNKDE